MLCSYYFARRALLIMNSTSANKMPSRVFFFSAATGVRVPLSKHRQRQALSQPGADGHQARHGPDRVHVLRAVPQHDQVSDFLRQGHPQRAAGVLQEDCRERTTSGNHVDPHRLSPGMLSRMHNSVYRQTLVKALSPLYIF